MVTLYVNDNYHHYHYYPYYYSKIRLSKDIVCRV